MPHFRLTQQISSARLQLHHRRTPIINGLSSNPITGEIFLADSRHKLIIVLPSARIIYRSKKIPYSVCYMSQKQTLLVCYYKDIKYKANAPPKFSLVALRQVKEKWVKQSRLPLNIYGIYKNDYLQSTICELADSELLFGVALTTQLYHLQVDPSNQLIMTAQVPVHQYYEMAATSKGGTRVALVHSTGWLALYSLRGDRLNFLSRVQLGESYYSLTRMLWMGGRLLVAKKNRQTQDTYKYIGDSILEMDVTGGPFVGRTELLPATAELNVVRWCAEGTNTVTICNSLPKLYVFEYEP